MKKIYIYLFVGFFFFLVPKVYSASITDISELGMGARVLGMGRAFVGMEGDSNSIFLNPAALSGIQSLRFSSMRTTLLSDINYTLLAGANSFKFGTLGLGWLNSSVGSIPLVRWVTVSGEQRPEQYASTDFSSNVFILSYSLPLGRILPGQFGLNFKYFTQNFSNTSLASLEGGTGTGFDMDLGFLWKPLSWATVALSAQNFLPTNLGGRFIWSRNNVEENIPCVVRLGTALNLLGSQGLKSLSEQQLNLTVDSEFNLNKSRPSLWRAGLEWWPVKVFALRFGIDQQANAGTAAIQVDNNLTCGVGLRIKGVTFDYAYHQFGQMTENTTHFFSIGYIGEDSTLPQIPGAPKRFVDVPQGYFAEKEIYQLAAANIFPEYSDNTFKPTWPLTYAELIKILEKSEGLNATKHSESLNHRYVTRAEGIEMIYKYTKLGTPQFITEKPYADVLSSSPCARAISAAKQDGLLGFVYGNNFEPDRYFTRAELAYMLYRIKFVNSAT